eukprot:Lankesteria_metandrocarpae@DN2770_c0_g1_i1.p1
MAVQVCCCNTLQLEGIITLSVTAFIASILWTTVVLSPIKLVAVFLHEISHAIATWLTCGKVTGIEINENFGGVCYSKGGNRGIILSAGYIGSCAWGSFFILMGYGSTATRVAAGVFIAACIATVLVLRIKDRKLCGCRCAFGLVIRVIILCMAAFVGGMWALEDLTTIKVHPLTWTVLMIGTVCTMTAFFDTIHDVLCKKIDNEAQGQSDAVMFSNEIGGSARCWGLLWSLIAFACIGLAFFGYLVLTSTCPTTV